MSNKSGKPTPPSDDPRWKHVQERMRNYGYQSHALIEVLHAVQETFDYLNEESLTYIASALHIPRSQVYGVATFYHLFSFKPPAQHTCVVCTGTACHVKGADKILDAIRNATNLQPDSGTGNTVNNEVYLETARCVGFCSPAPIVLYDGEAYSEQSPEAVVEHLMKWGNHAA